MGKTCQLEICANSVLSALNAQEGGADRVEFCQNLEAGGTTPSLGQVWTARALLSIGMHTLIRPRAGDFLYTDIEFSEMKADIMSCKEAKCDGVVIGILLADGQVDAVRMAELIALARPMQVTFHRAFDRCRDPFEALEVIIGLGCDRLLTSGLKDTAAEGAETIARLVGQANGRIEVMPGSGINEGNILQIAASTGASSFHTSAKVEMESAMDYIGGEVGGMGDTVWVSAKEKIRHLADMLKSRY
ncbi:copper homeostasis protein CutC [Parapedobacter sp.]